MHDALDSIRQIKRALLNRQRFKGWSGPTRILSGTLAIGAALALQWEWIPRSNIAHTFTWGTVFLAAMFLNLGALVYWFWNDPLIHRNPRRLGPLLDVMPPLFVGAVFTLYLLLHRQFDPLFGVWMCMFGLTNFASRHVLPSAIAWVGLFYILAGMICLFNPGIDFLDPWAMGLVFFAGEWAGGLILYFDERRYAAFERLWRQSDAPPTDTEIP